jgi:DNA topoisomerase-1
MNPLTIKATEKFAQKPPRYTEASLVKKLEELGIGRPSTYAPTISTITMRGYILKDSRPGQERSYKELTLENGKITSGVLKETWGAEKNKLFPEDIGIVVNDFLVENFKSIVDFNFTAKVEEDFDTVAAGKLVWNKLIDDFYKPFHKLVEDTLVISRPANAEKMLGQDPATGKNVYVRIGRFGPLAQIGDNDDPGKRFMSLGKGQLIETITLKEALKLFELPRVVGTYNDKEVSCAIGRFGPFIKYDGGFISLGKDMDPRTIDLENCIRLIEEHAKKERRNSSRISLMRAFRFSTDVLEPISKRARRTTRFPKGRILNRWNWKRYCPSSKKAAQRKVKDNLLWEKTDFLNKSLLQQLAGLVELTA